MPHLDRSCETAEYQSQKDLKVTKEKRQMTYKGRTINLK